jgi:ribonuclease-3
MRLKIVKDGVGLPNTAKKTTRHTTASASAQQHAAQVQLQQPLGQEHYGAIEELLGYAFKDRSWLERALTHRSVQVNGIKNDYERLEFLGDAVFDLAVAHLLLDKHEQAHEGDLSKMRAALVNTASLAEVARKLSLGKFIKLSRGELASGAHERPSILADVVEAVLGAVYREGGFAVACECVARLLGDSVATVTPRDPKTELQEALHASGSEAPVYRLECVEGPEHSPNFISVVEVDGQIVGRGRGTTKKASQQAAAEQALGLLKPKDDIDQRFLTSATSASNSNGAETILDGQASQTDSAETIHDV